MTMKNDRVRFGPSGNDVLFWQQGYKSSVQAPEWLAKMGLDAFEINFGRGLRMTDKTAQEIGEKAREHDVKISAHAPYFINLATSDPVKLSKSYGYIRRSLELLRIMGGRNLVVHVGSQGELERSVAIENCKRNLKTIIKRLNEEDGFFDFDYRICIETMGRFKPIGTHQEICDICSVDKRVEPTIDFGHINCLMRGELSRNPEAFAGIMDYCTKMVGRDKMQNVHIHYAAVKYGDKGELSHTTLDDPKYGIPFKPLVEYIKAHNLTPTIICESRDVMAQDAVKLKEEYYG